MIKARNIIKSYQNGESRFQVLKDISLDIEMPEPVFRWGEVIILWIPKIRQLRNRSIKV